jgi:hypothetical protein
MYNDLKQNYHDLRACNDYSKELGAFALLCYSRENGNPVIWLWIPAFAGMTSIYFTCNS